MSAIPSRHLPVKSTEPVFPLTVEQYHTMIQTGVLTDDDPVELLEGVLVFKMPKNPPHIYVVETAADVIRKMLGEGWFYSQQEPITLPDGEPEPDGAVIRGTRGDYKTRHPGPGDVALVIEVADSTLARDRGIKLRSYSRAGVQNYWIINLVDRCIEVYSRPDASGAEAVYLGCQIHKEAETVSLRIAEAERGTIAVGSLLP